MTAHSPAGAALAAITLPSDTVGQQAIVTLDALWAAYQTTIASGRAFSLETASGPLVGAATAHATRFAGMSAQAAASSAATAFASYQAEFATGNAMLSAAGVATITFDGSKATMLAMVVALQTAAGVALTPDIANDLSEMAGLIQGQWQPSFASPTAAAAAPPIVVGDEQPLTSVFIPRAQRYTAWLLGGG